MSPLAVVALKFVCKGVVSARQIVGHRHSQRYVGLVVSQGYALCLHNVGRQYARFVARCNDVVVQSQLGYNGFRCEWVVGKPLGVERRNAVDTAEIHNAVVRLQCGVWHKEVVGQSVLYGVVLKVVSLRAKCTQAAVGAEPYLAHRVLQHGVHHVARQTIVVGISLNLVVRQEGVCALLRANPHVALAVGCNGVDAGVQHLVVGFGQGYTAQAAALKAVGIQSVLASNPQLAASVAVDDAHALRVAVVATHVLRQWCNGGGGVVVQFQSGERAQQQLSATQWVYVVYAVVVCHVRLHPYRPYAVVRQVYNSHTAKLRTHIHHIVLLVYVHSLDVVRQQSVGSGQ